MWVCNWEDRGAGAIMLQHSLKQLDKVGVNPQKLRANSGLLL